MLARLALAYALRRPLSTGLVVLLLAIGTAVIAGTLVVARELESRLTRDAKGIDLVVGGKGSPLTLVLAGVYHLDVPPGNIPLATVDTLRANRLVAQAIPLALGDSLRGHRIVGTEPELIDHYGARFAEGAAWQAPMQAVLGSEVARATGLRTGDAFAGAHGLADGGAEHGQRYAVAGVLAPTGTVVDRLVLTSLESVWSVHEHHAAPGSGDAVAPALAAPGAVDARPDADEPREVTAVLVRYASPIAAASLPRAINELPGVVAASPALETARLFAVFGVGLDVVRALAALLVACSALMLFVALAQALEERRYDIAILRTLGAHPWQVAAVLLVEACALALVGALAGLALAHGAVALLPLAWPSLAPLAAAASRLVPEEALVVAIVLGAAILAASWPAWRAARLDVAATLAEG